MSQRRKITRARSIRGVRASAALPGPREFLEPLARILTAIGCTPQELERQFAAICRKLKKPKRPFEPLTSAYVADLSHVIARWHVDEPYVDAEGRPNALPLEGPGPSLKELIGKVLPEVDPAQAVRALIDLKGVRRQGQRYLPTDKYLALNRQPLAVWEHALTAVLGMLRTVEHNVSAPPGKRLLERVAMNPRFPVSALPRLHRSLTAEVPEILWKLDQKMFRKELYQKGKRFTRVGIGFYVFEDPQVTGIARGSGRRARGARRRMSKRSRGR
ncbi:MAG: DUF6502 family protein [Steroidobacteraceae bacterium]